MKHRFMYIYIHMVLKYLSVYIDCRYDLYMIVILYVYLRLKHMYNCILCIYAKAANTQLINDMQYLYVIKCIHVYNIYNINILADIYIYLYIDACILIPHMTWCLYSYILFPEKKTHEKAGIISETGSRVQHRQEPRRGWTYCYQVATRPPKKNEGVLKMRHFGS